MYIENIVIGKPIVETSTMFATNEDDWERIEKEKTYYTEKRKLIIQTKDFYQEY